MQAEETVYVPLKLSLLSEFIKRGREKEVFGMIEHAVEDFLDRTVGDGDLWSSEYVEKHWDEEDAKKHQEFLSAFGKTERGFQWASVFLPNGTELRMTYKGQVKYAAIRHEKLMYEDKSRSPSEFAYRVAANTSRNAWRDIWVKRPMDKEWIFADHLRSGLRR